MPNEAVVVYLDGTISSGMRFCLVSPLGEVLAEPRGLKFNALAYERLSKHTRATRRRLVSAEFNRAKLRYAKKKAEYLLYDYDLIEEKGGLTAANRAVLAADQQSGKIKALKEFKGIGEKYARNIMMDAYHPEFHNSIAVDQRIKNISKNLGLTFRKYNDYEEFYQRTALKLHVQPWELDRLLYKFETVILRSLKEGSHPTPEQIQETLSPGVKSKN